MIYGGKELHIYIDHENLPYANLTSERVLCWRLYLEEYNPQFHYIKGTENTLADALSHLTHKERQSAVARQPASPYEVLQHHNPDPFNIEVVKQFQSV